MTAHQAPRRAVFLDRDGTICEEMGYMNHISRFHLYPFAAASIQRMNQASLPVIVVTNQSGIARNFFPAELVERVHEKMTNELAAADARVDGIYYCPHKGDDRCECRKPRPGMLERAAREHNLALPGSFLVSDRYADLEMIHAVGGRSILVLTGYGRGDYEWHRGEWPRQPDFVAEDLSVAADIVVKELV